MELKATPKRIWALAYPVMLGGLVQNVVDVTDTMFVGRLSVTALSAHGLALIWYVVFALMGNSLGAAMQTLVARRLGEGRPRAVGRVVDHGMVVGLLLGAGALAVLWGVTPVALRALEGTLGLGLAEQAAAWDYVRYRAPEVVFNLIFWLVLGLHNGRGRTKVLMVAFSLVALLNIVLDYLLVFGHYGFPNLGIGGAGLASTLARATVTVLLLVHLWRHPIRKEYRLLRFRALKRRLVARVLRVAGPLILQHLGSILSFLVFMLFIRYRGEAEAAASNLARVLYLLFMIPTWGYASAANTLVSNTIGAGQTDQVRRVAWRIARLSFFSSAGLLALASAWPEPWLALVTDPDLGHAQVAEGATASLRQLVLSIGPVMVLALAVYALGGTYISAVIGTGATQVAFQIEVVTILLYVGMTGALALTPSVPLWGIWSAELVYLGVMGLLAWAYLRSGRWQRHSL